MPCYYEDIDKKTMEQIVRWLDRRTSGRLVFDERPDVYYAVVPSAKIEFEDYSYTKYGKTLHAGEFTIHFTAYDPFGKLTKKFLQTGEEMDYSTNLIPETQMPPAPSVTDTSFLVYNPGTERTGLILRVAGDAPNGLVIKNTTNGQELALLPFNQAVTTTAGKWFEIDSKKGQVYLVGAATRELAFEYHDKGYIALEANLGFEDGKTISFSQGGNTVTATDEGNGFSEDDIGKYIYTGDGWHKILSVSDATIIGHGPNMFNAQDSVLVSDGVTVDGDGWITFTADNSAGSNVIYRNYFTAPSDALKAGHEYLIIVEVAEMSVFGGNAVIRPISRSSEGNQTQFDDVWSMAVNSPAGTYVKKLRTLDDFSGATYMLRTDVLFYAGASGTVKIRLTVADEKPSLTLDNAQGQIKSVAVEAGCVAQQAGTGDPSPTNIRAISGRESVEVTACGKNLMPYKKPSNPVYSNKGITFTWNDNGSIHVVGTAEGNVDSNAMSFANFHLPPGDYRMIASGVSGVSPYFVVKKASTDSNLWYSANNIEIEDADIPQYFYITVADKTTIDATIYAFLSPGSDMPSPADYEPYTPMGGGVVTPSEPLYGLPDAEDTVEVDASGDVTVTRRTAVVELDGTENWGNYTGSGVQDGFLVPALVFADANMGFQTSKCSHFKNVNWAWALDTPWVYSDHETQLHKYFLVPKSEIADIAAWKSWLAAQKAAGTPVTIVYELAAPTTETPADVDPIEPQIGEVNVFTDADSLNITLYKTENNKHASVTGSFSQTENDFASMLTQMNEISISGEDVELTKLEIDYVPQVR